MTGIEDFKKVILFHEYEKILHHIMFRLLVFEWHGQ